MTIITCMIEKKEENTIQKLISESHRKPFVLVRHKSPIAKVKMTIIL